MATGYNVYEICILVNCYLSEIHNFFTTCNLSLLQAHSTATPFTTWTEEEKINLDIKVHGVHIKSCRNGALRTKKKFKKNEDLRDVKKYDISEGSEDPLNRR